MTQPAPYEDDLPSIAAGSPLLRRIAPQFGIWSDSGEFVRANSGSMQLYDKERALLVGCPGPGLSVVAVDLVSSLDDLVRTHQDMGHGLAYVSEELLRGDDERGIHYRPSPADPAHAVVFPFDPAQMDLPRGTKRALAKFASDHMLLAPQQP